MSKFLPTSGFKWIDPKEFDSNKYNSYSSTGCVLEVDLEYPKELRKLHNDYSKELCKLHNDYPLSPGKIKFKREILSKYQ